MKYTKEQDIWLKQNYPTMTVKECTESFNSHFGTSASYSSIKSHCNRKLNITTKNFYTEEEDEWLKMFYPTMSCEKVVSEFNNRFEQKRTRDSIISHCDRSLGLKSGSFHHYTKEELDWIKTNYPTHPRTELVRMFNEKFGCEITKEAIHTIASKRLHVCSDARKKYTKEQDEWLRDNYHLDESNKETERKFEEKFGIRKSAKSLLKRCKKMGFEIKNPYFKKGNITWNTGMSKEEYKSHFSEESFQSMTNTSKKNFPYINIRKEYEKQNGPIPDGYVLSERTPGSGEYILIRYDIYKNLSYYKVVGQGKLTETMADYLEVKKELDKLTKE